MDQLRFLLKRAPARVRDAAFALACRILLPIATTCKVCNMLRGMSIGYLLGVGTSCLAIAPVIHRWWGC
jgi:hypothetical protein